MRETPFLPEPPLRLYRLILALVLPMLLIRLGLRVAAGKEAAGTLAERLGFRPAPMDPTILIGDPAVIATRFRLTGEAWRGLNPPTA